MIQRPWKRLARHQRLCAARWRTVSNATEGKRPSQGRGTESEATVWGDVGKVDADAGDWEEDAHTETVAEGKVNTIDNGNIKDSND